MKKQLLASFFDKTFWRFVIVGIVNTLFGSGIMFLFYNVFHISYELSTASNYIFGSILSFFLNKYFTFKSQDNSISGIMRFTVNIAICYFVAYGCARPLARLILSSASVIVQDNISMLFGMGFFVILNYCGQRFFVFNKKKGK